MKSITIVGDIFCDIVASNISDLPRWGQDTLCGDISLVAGGSLINSAVHGANFAMYRDACILLNVFGSVGCDVQGNICMNALNKHSSICNNVIETPACATGSCIVLSGRQDRSFVTSRGCIATMKLDMFRSSFFENNTVHIHAAGFYNFSDAVKQSWGDVFVEAKRRGLTTSLNPQYDASGSWACIRELCTSLDFLITNELELLSITNQSSTKKGASILHGWGCECVVVTSREGASAFVKPHFLIKDTAETNEGNSNSNIISGVATSSIEYVQNVPCVDIQDTCGAGDAFAGAFLVEYFHSSRDLKAALRAGCIAGTAAVQVVGGSTVPSFELLDATYSAIASNTETIDL